MPIYEYVCRKCSKSFEELVFSGDAAPACPACQEPEAERVLSAFAVGRSEGGGGAAPREVGPCGNACGSGGGGGCPFN